MVQVVVVGGGLAGLAVSVRLARRGHDVTLLERATEPGGALRPVEADGHLWDGATDHTLLPAVVRDLFRKSGRPLEKELDLVPVPVVREHRWADGTTLTLPGASRLAQRRAAGALGDGLGDAWVAHVDSFAPLWSVLRRGYLESPRRPGTPGDREVARVLESRRSLGRHLRRALPDPRLVDVAAHPFVLGGHDLRRVPAWAGLEAYLVQCFGAWRFAGGTHRLVTALAARLGTRGVVLETGVDVRDVEVRAGRAVGVRTAAGTLDADAVICAGDPRGLPALARHLRPAPTVALPTLVHLGLEGDGPAPPDGGPHSLALHGDPGGRAVLLRPGVAAPRGSSAWTLVHRERAGVDVLDLLAHRGVDLRERVGTRLDLPPGALRERWGASPLGPLWAGRSTVHRRPGPRTPVPGLYAVGAHATPGPGIAFVGLSAALAVQALQGDLGLPTGAE